MAGNPGPGARRDFHGRVGWASAVVLQASPGPKVYWSEVASDLWWIQIFTAKVGIALVLLYTLLGVLALFLVRIAGSGGAESCAASSRCRGATGPTRTEGDGRGLPGPVMSGRLFVSPRHGVTMIGRTSQDGRAHSAAGEPEDGFEWICLN